jgi:hypothetical protein
MKSKELMIATGKQNIFLFPRKEEFYWKNKLILVG